MALRNEPWDHKTLNELGFLKVDGKIEASYSYFDMNNILKKKMKKEETIHLPKTKDGYYPWIAIFVK